LNLKKDTLEEDPLVPSGTCAHISTQLLRIIKSLQSWKKDRQMLFPLAFP